MHCFWVHRKKDRQGRLLLNCRVRLRKDHLYLKVRHFSGNPLQKGRLLPVYPELRRSHQRETHPRQSGRLQDSDRKLPNFCRKRHLLNRIVLHFLLFRRDKMPFQCLILQLHHPDFPDFFRLCPKYRPDHPQLCYCSPERSRKESPFPLWPCFCFLRKCRLPQSRRNCSDL